MSGRPTIIAIAEAAALEAGLTAAVVMGTSQIAPVSLARHRAWYLTHELRPDLSLSMIGRTYGRDHSTVCAGVHRVARRLLGSTAAQNSEAAALAAIRSRLAEPSSEIASPPALLVELDEQLAVASAALDRARVLRQRLVGGWA